MEIILSVLKYKSTNVSFGIIRFFRDVTTMTIPNFIEVNVLINRLNINK